MLIPWGRHSIRCDNGRTTSHRFGTIRRRQKHSAWLWSGKNCKPSPSMVPFHARERPRLDPSWGRLPKLCLAGRRGGHLLKNPGQLNGASTDPFRSTPTNFPPCPTPPHCRADASSRHPWRPPRSSSFRALQSGKPGRRRAAGSTWHSSEPADKPAPHIPDAKEKTSSLFVTLTTPARRTPLRNIPRRGGSGTFA